MIDPARLAPPHRQEPPQEDGDENMLGIVAAVLIVLWLLGFFAFQITTAFIHIALLVGLVLLALHFARAGEARA
jgi:hypothetical protein